MKRRGFSFIELAAALALLMTLISISNPLIVWMVQERRASDQKVWATQEAANIMQLLAARDWEDLTAEKVQDIELSEPAQAKLRNGKLKIDITTSPEVLEARRIRIEIHWRDNTGQQSRPVRLTAWRYR